LTSALDGVECSTSRSGRFTTREGAPVTQRIGDWVGLRSHLDAGVKRKILTPAGARTADHPACTPALYPGSNVNNFLE